MARTSTVLPLILLASGMLAFAPTGASSALPFVLTRPSLATSCDGVAVRPTDDIQAILDAHPARTTFCFEAGTYVLDDKIVPKSYDSLIGLSGAVLTGLDTNVGGIRGFAGSAGNHDVRVRGFIVERFLNDWSDAGFQAPISPGDDWIIENNVVRHNAQAGISTSNGTVIRRNNIHHNGRIGITGGPVSHVLIKGNEIAFNNTSGCSVGDHAGGTKIIAGTAGSSNIVFARNRVHDNTGHGFWIDTNVRKVIIKRNTFENNSSSGVFYETSWDGVIRNNALRNNAAEVVGKSCYWGAQIHLNDSQNVAVDGNTVVASNGANGICAVDIDRTTPGSSKVADLNVQDNVIKVKLSGTSGLVGRPASYHASASNEFTSNTYYVTDRSKKAWAWSTYPLTWRQWRGSGNDTTGRRRIW